MKKKRWTVLVIPLLLLLFLSSVALADGPYRVIKLEDTNIQLIRNVQDGLNWVNLIGDNYSVRASYPIGGTSPEVQFGFTVATLTAISGQQFSGGI